MRILNFGSLNIDYVYGVEHFIRPGETMSSIRRDVLAGGKGLNQSVALARSLGGAESGGIGKSHGGQIDKIEIFHAGGIGKADGTFLKKLLAESGVNVDYVYEHDEASGHAIIQVEPSGQNCIILFGGANQMQSRPYVDKVLANFSAGDFLVLQNEINELSYIIEKAHEKGLVIFLNPSPCDEKISKLPLQYVDYFLLNEVEAADILGMSAGSGVFAATENLSASKKLSAGSGKISADEMISSLRKKFTSAKIVLTLGKDGVAFFDGEKVYKHGVYDVKVVDTTAAGDTFTGYFVSGVAQKFSPEETLRLASVASSIAVSRKGAAPSIPTIDEVNNFAC